jgi:hypothetical protein
MMVSGNFRSKLNEWGRPLGQQIRSDAHMALHDRPLFFRKRPWFMQNIIWNSDLADIVKRRHNPQRLYKPLIKTHCCRDVCAEFTNSARVLTSVVIPKFARGGQQVHCLSLSFL